MMTWLGLVWSRRRDLRWAHEEADQLIDSAKKDAEARLEELNLQVDEMREGAMEKLERETRKQVLANEEYEDRLLEQEMKFKDAAAVRDQLLNRKNQALLSRRHKIEKIEERARDLKTQADGLRQRLMQEAEKRSPIPASDLRQKIQDDFEREVRTAATKRAQEIEQEAHLNMERDAKKILSHALNRFARPYCPERGIGNVEFESEAHVGRTFGPDKQFVKHIEKICGVDIVYNETYQSAAVMGFDPVRRELGRLVLEATARNRNPSEPVIDDIFNRAKKDLFKRILVDGNRVAKELGLQGLHEDVRSMLGALRYRYSFAQNQYFHVAEVGWLGGLLSSELGVDWKSGRRAGVLHDIGKAMDHSRDGGHAVIGADFIEKNGEQGDIVHAVRAHHYDEQPSSDLAFVTIAADAISGARPGARRSTMDSYTQKMADLEKIGSSFEGVTATYILSAGREVRVMVDGHRVDDQRALDLSKKIAEKIEDELNYPGLIKVTVVRETQAVEYAR